MAIYAPSGQTPREDAKVNYATGGSVMAPSVRFSGLYAELLNMLWDVCDRMERAPWRGPHIDDRPTSSNRFVLCIYEHPHTG